MNKQEIKQDIRRCYGQGRGLMNTSEIARYMGCGRQSSVLQKVIKGKPCIDDGRSKRYSLDDVADGIMSLYEGM